MSSINLPPTLPVSKSPTDEELMNHDLTDINNTTEGISSSSSSTPTSARSPAHTPSRGSPLSHRRYPEPTTPQAIRTHETAVPVIARQFVNKTNLNNIDEQLSSIKEQYKDQLNRSSHKQINTLQSKIQKYTKETDSEKVGIPPESIKEIHSCLATLQSNTTGKLFRALDPILENVTRITRMPPVSK